MTSESAREALLKDYAAGHVPFDLSKALELADQLDAIHCRIEAMLASVEESP